MSEIKVNLSLELQGSTMLSEQECSKNSKDNYNYFRMEVTDANKKNKSVLNVAVRKSRTVKQNIKLSKEAYDYMTDKTLCPSKDLMKIWRKLTVTQRLKWHCKQIAESLGATGFHFEVLDD